MKLNPITALLISGVMAAAVAGCGSGSDSPSTGAASSDYDCDKPDASSPTDIKIAGVPILTNGALYVGKDQGFFEDHGLKPSIEVVATIQASVAAVVGGSVDFAFATTQNLLGAVSQGQSIRGVAPFAGIEPGYKDKMEAGEEGYETGINALLVQDDSDIESPADLEGKTVAVQDPAFTQLMVQWVIKEDGGDPSKVKYVLMPGADAYTAIQAGQVDAAYSFQPLIAGFEDKGLRNLSWLEVDVFEEGPMSYMISSNKFIEGNADVVARFNCAMAESARYANENPDDVREAIAREQGVDPSTYAAQKVSWFFDEPDFDSLDRIQTIMVEFGQLKETLDAEDVMASVVTKGRTE